MVKVWNKKYSELSGWQPNEKIVRPCWWCGFFCQHGNRRNTIHGWNNGDWALYSGQLHRSLHSNNIIHSIATSLGVKLLLCCTGWFQEESSKFLEVIVSVIVRKNVHMNMCLFLNGHWDRAVSIYPYKSNVNCNKEREISYCYLMWFWPCIVVNMWK